MPMRWRCPPENSCGIALGVLGLKADAVEQVADPRVDVATGRDPVQFHGLADDLADPLAGVQRRVRVLEDHLHLASHGPHGPPRPADEFLALELDRTRRRRGELQDRPAQRGLAATGFADQAQRLALVDGEADAVDGLHPADLAVDDDSRLDREVLDQVRHFEQGGGHDASA